jgi:hypothetical protein
MRSATSASRSDPDIQPGVGRERLPGSIGPMLPALLLLASGAAALVYQVLWIKQLSLVVGVDVYAVTTGVSAFFAGLALGGALFGRWADRLAQPLLLYALLELGVAVLGIAATLALARAAAAVGLCAVTRGSAARRARWATLAIGVAVMLVAIITPPDRLASLLPGARSGTLVFYEESRGGTVAVVQQQTGQNRFKRLYIQGVSNSGDAMPSLRYMRLQALLPLIIHGGEPRSALVVGLGAGITAGALLRFPGLERRVCAELLSAVVRAAPLFQGNFGAASDPRIDLRLRDGRRELLQNPERYDLITLEPPPMPPLRGADAAFLAEAADERARLLRFYDVGLHAYNGERELWAREMNWVMREGGRNPYYRWFVGGVR